MSPKFKILILFASATIGMWLIYDSVFFGLNAQRIALLLYISLVIVLLLKAPLQPAQKTVMNQPSANPSQAKEDAEAIVLSIIRQIGKAQRHDLLPQLGISRSSLGQLLDQMEANGLIRQEGDRKASHYVLAGK